MLLTDDIVLAIRFPQADNLNVKKNQGPRPSFAHVQHRLGRSFSLPTQPCKRANRYEVVGEVAIRFYLILLKRHRILSRIHIFVGVFLIS